MDVQVVRASYRSPKTNGDPEKKSDGERSRGKKQGPAAAFRSLSLHISVFSQRRDITIRSSFRLGIPLRRTCLLSIVKKRDLVSRPIAQHVGRNHLADHQPAVLLLQAKVRSLSSSSLYTLGTSDKPKANTLKYILTFPQNREEAELLPQRAQCHRPLQPPVMPPRQLPLCYDPPAPHQADPLPLHEDD